MGNNQTADLKVGATKTPCAVALTLGQHVMVRNGNADLPISSGQVPVGATSDHAINVALTFRSAHDGKNGNADLPISSGQVPVGATSEHAINVALTFRSAHDGKNGNADLPISSGQVPVGATSEHAINVALTFRSAHDGKKRQCRPPDFIGTGSGRRYSIALRGCVTDEPTTIISARHFWQAKE